MKCPACGDGTEVQETRPVRTAVRRRRVCKTCSTKVTTVEVIVRTPQETQKILRLVTTTEKGPTT